MQIVKIEAIPLRYRLPKPIWDAHLHIPHRDALIVRVSTDAGLVGIGEAAVFGGAMGAVAAVIHQQLTPILIGSDPLLIEQRWRQMYEHTVHLGRTGMAMAAISGIDIALWDLAGKAAGLPLFRLLGGFREELVPYASGGFYAADVDVQVLREEIASYKERGFRAGKMKIGALSPREDAERVEAVRRMVGEDFELLLDANCGYTPRQAIELALRVEGFGVGWLEEPVRVDDVEGSTLVARESPIPIAGYESESSLYAFRRLIQNRAVDVVQADAIWAGGISNVRKIADLAAAWHLEFVPHVYSSAVSLAANMHLLAACANGGRLEFDGRENPLREELVDERIGLSETGSVRIPETPGLGISLNEESLTHYRLE